MRKRILAPMWVMRPRTFLVAALAVTPFTSITGQQRLPVVPGDRVRVYASQTADGQWGQFVGRIVGWVPDSVLLRTDDDVNVVAPVASITRLEVSWGRKSHVGRGAAFGALIGIPLGAVVGLSAYEECVPRGVGWSGVFSCFMAPTEGQTALIGAILGGAGGAILGAILGGTIKTEHWEEVPLDRLRVSFAPQRDGRFAFGLSVRF